MNAIVKFSLAALALIAIRVHAQESYVSTSRSGDKYSYKSSTGGSSFNIELRGKIELTDDDKDIKTMSADGYLEVSKTVFGSRRALVITPNGNSLKREYYEGRTATNFEPEGRKWMGEILPELVRTTTIGAESRVARFYRQGGISGVLSEIDRLESDHIKTHYANALMKQQPVPTRDYANIINRIAGTVDSDHYLTEFLKNNLDKFLTTRESTDAVFAATEKMESDHYKTEVIKEGLRSQSASPEAVRSILAAAGRMDSDHYKTEVLTTLLKQSGLTDAIISEMITATRSIDSDHYRSVVLNKALEKDGLSASSYQKVLESVKDIDSDHYKAQVINNLLKSKIPSQQIQTLISISSSIESDHYVTEVLSTVMNRQELTDETLKIVTDRVSNMGSDHYASIVLRTALKSGSLTNAKLISIIQSASNIDSDHYITEVLTEAAPKVRAADNAVKDAYRAAAKKIDSETYYGRAMKAIE